MLCHGISEPICELKAYSSVFALITCERCSACSWHIGKLWWGVRGVAGQIVIACAGVCALGSQTEEALLYPCCRPSSAGSRSDFGCSRLQKEGMWTKLVLICCIIGCYPTQAAAGGGYVHGKGREPCASFPGYRFSTDMCVVYKWCSFFLFAIGCNMAFV